MNDQSTVVKYPDPILCQCGHNMGRSRCKPDGMGGWCVRCNKCKTVYDVSLKFPTEDLSVKKSAEQTDQLAQRFADDLRLLMYGGCDPIEQVNRLATTLAEYDGVPVSSVDNHLLSMLTYYMDGG